MLTTGSGEPPAHKAEFAPTVDRYQVGYAQHRCRKKWSTSSTRWAWTSPTSASSTTPSWPSSCWSDCFKARSSHASPATSQRHEENQRRARAGDPPDHRLGGGVQNKKFSDMLSDVVQRYQNRSIEAAQVMEELVQRAKKFREAASRGEKLGLNEDEVRFYDALAENESAVRELTDETLKKIAHEMAETCGRT